MRGDRFPGASNLESPSLSERNFKLLAKLSVLVVLVPPSTDLTASAIKKGNAVDLRMQAWELDAPGELTLRTRDVPKPGRSEVLVRIDAVAVCATDLDVIANGPPALINGKLPFGQNFIPGHEYMGTIVELGPEVDEYAVGERVVVEIHAGCGQCKRCRSGMYTSCLNYGRNYPGRDKGHRANGFTSNGGFAQYAINHINTLVRVPECMSDAEAALAVTAGTSMYGFTEMGGLIAGESVAVVGPGPIGLLAAAVAKALGANPVILIGTRENRLQIGAKLGADTLLDARETDPVNAVLAATGGKGVDYVMECAGTEQAINQAIHMCSRGGKICLAAFPHGLASIDLAHAVMNNIYLYGIRGEGKSAVARAVALMKSGRFDATLIHTHSFGLNDLPEALRHARERIDGAIKVILTPNSDR